MNETEEIIHLIEEQLWEEDINFLRNDFVKVVGSIDRIKKSYLSSKVLYQSALNL